MSLHIPIPVDPAPLFGSTEGLRHALLAQHADIAVVIDRSGVVTALVQDESTPMSATAAAWVGQPWSDTVAAYTQAKMHRLLCEAGHDGTARRYEINHDDGAGGRLPVAYTAARLDALGAVLAIGHDLRGTAAIQQRSIVSQQSLEGGYWRSRHEALSPRWLRRVAHDGALTVDARSQRVLALNAAAGQWLGVSHHGAEVQSLAPLFEARSRAAVATVLAQACADGQTHGTAVRLPGSHTSLHLLARALPASDGRLLLHLRPGAMPDIDSVDDADEGIVVTDAAGCMQDANRAFMDMIQVTGLEQIRDRSFDDVWHGPGRVVLRRVQAQGVASARRLALQRADGTVLPVQLSGAQLAEVAGGEAGYTLRCLGAGLNARVNARNV